MHERCPRCKGDVRIERQVDGDEAVCIACGWRGPAPERRVVTAADPFDQVDACKTALGWVQEREMAAATEGGKRRDQRLRISKALEVLTETKRAGGNPRNGICADCGNHKRSNAHRDRCKAPA